MNVPQNTNYSLRARSARAAEYRRRQKKEAIKYGDDRHVEYIDPRTGRVQIIHVHY